MFCNSMFLNVKSNQFGSMRASALAQPGWYTGKASTPIGYRKLIPSFFMQGTNWDTIQYTVSDTNPLAPVYIRSYNTTGYYIIDLSNGTRLALSPGCKIGVASGETYVMTAVTSLEVGNSIFTIRPPGYKTAALINGGKIENKQYYALGMLYAAKSNTGLVSGYVDSQTKLIFDMSVAQEVNAYNTLFKVIAPIQVISTNSFFRAYVSGTSGSSYADFYTTTDSLRKHVLLSINSSYPFSSNPVGTLQFFYSKNWMPYMSEAQQRSWLAGFFDRGATRTGDILTVAEGKNTLTLLQSIQRTLHNFGVNSIVASTDPDPANATGDVDVSWSLEINTGNLSRLLTYIPLQNTTLTAAVSDTTLTPPTISAINASPSTAVDLCSLNRSAAAIIGIEGINVDNALT